MALDSSNIGTSKVEEIAAKNIRTLLVKSVSPVLKLVRDPPDNIDEFKTLYGSLGPYLQQGVVCGVLGCQFIEFLLLGESQAAEWEQDTCHHRRHRRHHTPETDRSQAGPEWHYQPLLTCGAWPTESVPGVASTADENVSARYDVSDVVTAPAPPAPTTTIAETLSVMLRVSGIISVNISLLCTYILMSIINISWIFL